MYNTSTSFLPGDVMKKFHARDGMAISLLKKNGIPTILVTKEKTIEITRELYLAMKMISKSNIGPKKQFNSFGCSIKWKLNE